MAGRSSGYAVYSEIFEDGIYWAPYYEMQVARFMAGSSGIGKISAGAQQWVNKEIPIPGFGPMYHTDKVWLHAIRHSELTDAHHAGRYVNFDRFLKEYEIDPAHEFD